MGWRRAPGGVSGGVNDEQEVMVPYVATVGYDEPCRLLRFSGMGATTGQYIASGATAATSAAGAFMSPTVGGKVSGAGGVILAAAPFAGPGAPVVAIAGAVVAAAGQIMSFLGIGQGCGQSCILTSDWANQAEALLRQNISAYFAQSAPRLKASQDAALAGFDAIWGQLAGACAKVPGAAGANCTGDRQQGACKWKATADSPWPGGPAQGSCWNWFNAYRDPIAHDTDVVADAQTAAQLAAAASGGSVQTGGGASLLPLLLIGGLVVAGVML